MKTENTEFERLMQDYLKDKLSSSDLQKLLGYLNSDPIYRLKYKNLVESHALSFAPLFEKVRKDNFKQLSKQLNLSVNKKYPFYSKKIGYVAAVFLLLLSFTANIYLYHNPTLNPTPSKSFCSIENTKDSHIKLLLPDSTIVHLNKNSTLKYDPSFNQQAKREVHLEGEGYFEVKENTKKPFIVHTENINVKVLGTVFNISSYSNAPAIKVSLIKGSVNVFTYSEAEDNLILSPGEQATYDKEQQLLTSRNIDISEQTSWLKGKLVFSNQSLREILKTIEAKWNIEIQVQSQLADIEYFSGSIDVNLNINEVLTILDVDNKFSWKRDGKKITLTEKQ